MMSLLHIVLGLMCSLGLAVDYEVMLALNCGSVNDIKTELLTYQKDNFYSNNSRGNHKSYLSRSIRDQQERSLLKTDRTSSDSFMYRLPMKQEGKYGIAVKFIEVARNVMQQNYAEVGMRIFNLRLGEDVVLSVDIFKEAGAKRPLTKYFEFELRKDVVYLNKSDMDIPFQYPVLNGYNYEERKLQLVFEKVKGDPKVEAIVLIRGSIEAFRNVYEEKQHKRQGGNLEFLCEKIYNVQERIRTTINHTQSFRLRESISYSYYLDKLFSVQGFLSLAIFLLMLYQPEIKEKFTQLKLKLELKLRAGKTKNN